MFQQQLLRNVYDGEKRVKILAIVQSMSTISPIISPVIGAIILNVLSWRGVFIVLVLVGCLIVTLSIPW